MLVFYYLARVLAVLVLLLFGPVCCFLLDALLPTSVPTSNNFITP